MTTRTHSWLAFAVLGLLASPFALFTDGQLESHIWAAAYLVGGLAVVGGIRLHRPSDTLPWRLLAFSFVVFAIAEAISPFSVSADESTRQMAADLINICGYVLLGVVALNLVRHQTPRGDRDNLIDALIVMMSLTTVLWSLTFGGDPLTNDLPLLNRGFFVVSLLVPSGVAAMCLRLLSTSGRQIRAAALLGTAGAVTFVATLMWALDVAGVAQIPAVVIDLPWLLATVAAPAAALHPSMRELTQCADVTHESVSRGRLWVLGLSLLAAPMALLHAAGAVDGNIALPVAGSALVSVLVLARLARLVSDHERARREVLVQAAHQAALSDLAADALTGHSIRELYVAATTILHASVGEASVRIVPRELQDVATPSSRLEPAGTPIAGLDGPVADIVVDGDMPTDVDDEARRFLTAVAHILGSAVQRRQAEQELEHRATHDALTGLPGRAQLFDRLERALVRRDTTPVGVLFIDLDGFKPINDTHGHDAGDRLLVTVSSRMSRVVRAGDTVARLSGDEFVVLLDPCTALELSEIADRILARISEPIQLVSGGVSISASIGALLTDPGDQDPESVLRRADRAMYEAKRSDGRSVVVAGEPDATDHSEPVVVG